MNNIKANRTPPLPTLGRKQFIISIYGLLIASALVDMISALDSNEYRSDEYDIVENTTESSDWDIIIFTQQWPVTTCFHWKQENKDHQCNLPTKKEVWTIHGLWPTKIGSFGPNFCNKSAIFDVEKLEPIVDRLFLFWPDIETGTDYDFLWKHEWLKHGTCAAEIETLGSELKYFNQGLNWHSGFFMTEILEKSGILPDSNITLIALHKAIVKEIGKNPSIQCLYDNKNDISYLVEIRLCFDKNFQLIDCDGVKMDDVSIDYPGGTVNTNCHVSRLIYYPTNVPPLDKSKQRKEPWRFPFVNVYKLVQLLIWSTL